MRPASRPVVTFALALVLCLAAYMAAAGFTFAARGPAPPQGGAGQIAIEAAGHWPFPRAGLRREALEKIRLETASLWLNAKPLFTVAEDPSGRRGIVSLAPSLEGKAVLLHFWDYTNAHCLNMVPLLETWHKRYAGDGLVVVGVHSPEFAFSSRSGNVAEAVKQLEISYPVYLDSEFFLWRIFENRHWPRTVLIARDGSVVYDVVGSANSEATERAVRKVLHRTRGRKFTEPLLPPLISDREDSVCHPDSADLFCGFERGRLGSPGYSKDGAETSYHIPSHEEVRQDDVIYLEGNWRATRQALFAVGSEPWELRLRFRAVGVGLVMTPPRKMAGARVRVTLDGKPVPPLFRGDDLRADPGGETYFTIGTPRLLQLVAQAPFASHEIALFPEKPGTGFYVFYFEGCEKKEVQ